MIVSQKDLSAYGVAAQSNIWLLEQDTIFFFPKSNFPFLTFWFLCDLLELYINVTV